MTQFNLLPDIKLDYLKAERNRRLVIAISVLVSALAVIIVGILFSITEVQKVQINNLSKDIKQQGTNLAGQSNLSQILTVQNQIQTLATLHAQEPQVSNLATYLNQTIPTTASLNSLAIDFTQNTITMSGAANNLATVNQLVDSLKFATYSISGQPGTTPAFTNVVMTSFGVGQQGANFTINLNFDPNLFNNTETVTLTVPSQVTTRSQLSQPTTLFNQTTNKNGGQ